MRLRGFLFALAFAPLPAAGESVLFVVDPSQLPFDLGPGSRQNAPANVANSPSQYGNSAGNHTNSASARANAPGNPVNMPGGAQAIYTGDGGYAGYATQAGGALNLFDPAGRRVAYSPAGGHTKSLFSTAGEWCGTVAQAQGGSYAFGMTLTCAQRFFGN